MLRTSAQLGSNAAHNLGITTPSLPQVVFATQAQGITNSVVLCLYDNAAQFYTQTFDGNNSLTNQHIPIMHSPNSDNNKGE